MANLLNVLLLSTLVAAAFTTRSVSQECAGTVPGVSAGQPRALYFSDGSGLALLSRMNINIDGSARAYHVSDNSLGLIHLCNAGTVYLPNGTRYAGSESNEVCTGRFMTDYNRIREAGWNDPAIGAISWYGILGQGEVTVGGNRVRNIVPVEQPGNTGFYVSPTALQDPSYPVGDQRRYVDPLTVPAAVIPQSQYLTEIGVVLGTTGVAIDPRIGVPVPFVVGDIGPRFGEGSSALARMVAGLTPDPSLPRSQRYLGAVSEPRILWVFFGGDVLNPPFDAAAVVARAGEAYEEWGGAERLTACVDSTVVPVG